MINRDAKGEVILPEQAKTVISDFIEEVDFRLMDKLLRSLLLGYLKNNNGDEDVWFTEKGLDLFVWLYYLNDTFEAHFAERIPNNEDDEETENKIALLREINQELKQQMEHWREAFSQMQKSYSKIAVDYSELLAKTSKEKADEKFKFVEEHLKGADDILQSSKK